MSCNHRKGLVLGSGGDITGASGDVRNFNVLNTAQGPTAHVAPLWHQLPVCETQKLSERL